MLDNTSNDRLCDSATNSIELMNSLPDNHQAKVLHNPEIEPLQIWTMFAEDNANQLSVGCGDTANNWSNPC